MNLATHKKARKPRIVGRKQNSPSPRKEISWLPFFEQVTQTHALIGQDEVKWWIAEVKNRMAHEHDSKKRVR